MSGDFLAHIRSFCKSSLTPVCTRVTLPTGIQMLQTASDTQGTVLSQLTAGFVVDCEPDPTVGLVLPYLVVGSVDVAESRELLQQLGVTHVLSCCCFSSGAFPDELVCKNLQMLDVPEYDLNECLAEAFQFIDSARRSSGVCLVHCNAGISRSTSVVIAYLICVQGKPFDDAMKTVQEVYPKAKPNSGFLKQLKRLAPVTRSAGQRSESGIL